MDGVIRPVASSSHNTLWENVIESYQTAQQKGAAHSIDTLARIVHDDTAEVTFILRLATALRSKPSQLSASRTQDNKKKEFINPFLPYDENLWVQHLSPSHTLLLNKYNVVAHHVLVVTRDFESQGDPPNALDLSATWAVLQAMPEGGIAFYNCGDVSGASQPHKHLQVVPLPLAEGQPPVPPFQSVLARAVEGAGPLQARPLEQLPFRSYCCSLPPSPSGVDLVEAFSSLQAARSDAATSYNLLITQQFMQLVPRSQAGCGPVSINSLGYVGTFLLRSEEEIDYVQSTGPMKVLELVGIPW